jgi:hypothetical protein
LFLFNQLEKVHIERDALNYQLSGNNRLQFGFQALDLGQVFALGDLEVDLFVPQKHVFI